MSSVVSFTLLMSNPPEREAPLRFFSLGKIEEKWNQCIWGYLASQTWRCPDCSELMTDKYYSCAAGDATLDFWAYEVREEWPDAIHVGLGSAPLFSKRVIDGFKAAGFTGFRAHLIPWTGISWHCFVAPESVPEYYGIEVTGSCQVSASDWDAGKPIAFCPTCGREPKLCLTRYWRFLPETWTGDDFIEPIKIAKSSQTRDEFIVPSSFRTGPPDNHKFTKPAASSWLSVTPRVIDCIVRSGWTNFSVGGVVPEGAVHISPNLTHNWQEMILTKKREWMKKKAEIEWKG